MMNRHASSWWVMMLHHDESSRSIMMNHHDSYGSSWFIIMNQHDSSWWVIMVHHDESWWFTMINHDGWTRWFIVMNHEHGDSSLWITMRPWKDSFQGFHCLFALPWVPWHFAKAPFCHGRLFTMAHIALFTSFLQWLPWRCSISRPSKWDNVTAKWQHNKQLSDQPQCTSILQEQTRFQWNM